MQLRTLILATGAAVILAASPGSAAPVTFGYTGATVDYAVPADGQYRITATGARGGSVPDGGGAGGLGAQVSATFALAQGEVLRILAGAAGADGVAQSPYFDSFAGGGGGSFVVGPNGQALVVAGGGGGGGQLNASYPPDFQPVRGGSSYNGGDALTGPDGGASPAPTTAGNAFGGGAGGAAGSDGQGGQFAVTSLVNAGRGFNSFPFGPGAAFGGGASGGGGLADTIAEVAAGATAAGVAEA